jgi:hypothetical protein
MRYKRPRDLEGRFMRFGLTGQNTAIPLAHKAGLGVVLAFVLAGCTTMEGGNAFSDARTFEREVMMTTARGVGLVPGEAPPPEPTAPRAPLVLPASGQGLPAPAAPAAAAQLPANSDTVRIDTTNLSQADIQRLRNTRVLDANSLSGRALTPEEARALASSMQSGGIAVGTAARPLYLPPAEYFTRVGNSELVCSLGNGVIVALNDPRCPPAVREALQRMMADPARSNGSLSTGNLARP